MNLGRALGRVAATRRTFGVAAAVHEVQQRAINRVVRFHMLECMALVVSGMNPALADPGPFRAGFARRDEMLAHARAEYDLTPTFVEEAFAQGDECFALWDGDRLASSTWHSKTPTVLGDGLVVRVDPSWIYRYKSFTHPDYRGRRLHAISQVLAVRSYAERGWRGVTCYVRSDNFPSLRSSRRSGYRTFGHVYLVQMFDRSLTWSTPGCKRYGFRVERTTARATPDTRS